MAAIPTSQPKPVILVPGVAQVEMIYTSTGQRCENVYHVTVHADGSPVTDANMDTLAQIFEQWESVTARVQRCNQTVLSLIRVRDLSLHPGLVKEYTPVSNVTGAGTDAPAPGNVTLAMRWSTGRGGRSFRGRTFHIGLTQPACVGNTVLGVTRTNLVAMYAALITAVNNQAGFKLAVVSYAANKFWRSTGVATNITAVSADPNLDSQRRRLAGRGT